MSKSFYIEMQGLEELERDLGMLKDKSKMVLRGAINNTAKQLEKQMAHDANKRYKLEDGLQGYKSANVITKATTSKLEATIRSRGPVLDMSDYMMKPSTQVYPGGRGAPSWIKAKVLRKSRLTGIARFKGSRGDKYKGFMVRFHNGHEAFVSRRPGSVSSSTGKEIIETIYSPAVSKGEEVVYRDEMEDDVDRMLLENIEQQIQRFLG